MKMEGEKQKELSKASSKRKIKKTEETNSEKSDRYVFETVAKYLTDTGSEINFLEHPEQCESEKSRKVVIKKMEQ